MHDKVVCLGCGLIVDGPGEWGCRCPLPGHPPRSAGSTAPSSGASSGPYRTLPPAAPCPRCDGRLAEARFHDAGVLDCAACGGLFLPKRVIDELVQSDRGDLRLAFPKRERVPEPLGVRYLNCPVCARRMNRENFGALSGVVVDVCAADGVWFDAGEVNAVIAFVEQGGLERSEQLRQGRRADEKARLHAQWLVERAAAERATPFRSRGIGYRRYGAMLGALLRWLER